MLFKTKSGVGLSLCLAAAIAMDTAIQLCWKIAAPLLPDEWSIASTVNVILHEPLFIALIVMMLGHLLIWLLVLEQADLTYARSVASLSYVTVCVVSALYLQEKIDLMQWIGIGAVMFGVGFITRTSPVTSPDRIAPQ